VKRPSPKIGRMHNEVFDGFAQAIWANAYAEAVETMVSEGMLRRAPWSGGGQVTEHVPSVPRSLVDRVSLLFDERLPDVRDTVETAYDAARRDRYDAPTDAEQFGWQLGMAWIGTGSALPDAAKPLLRKLGNGEVYLSVQLDRTGAPGKASVDYASLPELPRVEANRKRRASRRRASKRTSRRRR
jgi:hypothetical protein